MEKRSFATELRTEQSAGKTYLVGRAASYNTLSHDLGGWRELIEPGAFDDALADSDLDCLHTLNHDPSKILGRTLSGTTKLTSDSRGLSYRTLLPDVSYARDAAELCKRGDLSQSSFAFQVDPDDEDWTETDDPDNPGVRCGLRTISRVARLFDVATVASPAYPETAAGVTDRSLPGTMPAELRARILQRAAADDETECECDCRECEDDRHEECSNEDCIDEACAESGCPYASSSNLPSGGGDIASVEAASNELAYEEAMEEPA
jgi:HK97 family phage prohead protease